MHLSLDNHSARPAAPPSRAPRLRVLISGGLAAGGPQTHVPLLCAVLQQAGAEVTIASASTNWSAAALKKLRGSGGTLVVSPFGFGPLQVIGQFWREALLTPQNFCRAAAAREPQP